MPIIERRGENNLLKGRRSGELIIENLNKPRKSTRQPTTQPRAKSGSRERIPHISSEWRVMTKGRMLLLLGLGLLGWIQLKDSKAGQMLGRAFDDVGTITTTVNGKDNCVQMDGFEDCTGSSEMQNDMRPGASVADREAIGLDWMPECILSWGKWIVEAANANAEHELTPKEVAVFMLIESGGYSRADSGKALGLMQFTPDTFKMVASELGYFDPNTDNRLDPKKSIFAGAKLMADIWERNKGKCVSAGISKIACMSIAYNAGEGHLQAVISGQKIYDESNSHATWAEGMLSPNAEVQKEIYQKWLAAGGQIWVDKAKAEMNGQ